MPVSTVVQSIVLHLATGSHIVHTRQDCRLRISGRGVYMNPDASQKPNRSCLSGSIRAGVLNLCSHHSERTGMSTSCVGWSRLVYVPSFYGCLTCASSAWVQVECAGHYGETQLAGDPCLMTTGATKKNSPEDSMEFNGSFLTVVPGMNIDLVATNVLFFGLIFPFRRHPYSLSLLAYIGTEIVVRCKESNDSGRNLELAGIRYTGYVDALSRGIRGYNLIGKTATLR